MRGFTYALIAIILWSSAATFGNLLNDRANSLGIVTFLFIGGILLFGSWSFFEKEIISTDLKKIFKNKCCLKVSSLIASFGLFLGAYYVSFYYAVQNAPSIEANVINYLWPILTPIFAVYIFRTEVRKFGFYDLALLFVSFLGAMLAAWDITKESFESFNFTSGHASALVAAICAAAYLNFIFLIKKYISSTPFIYFLGMLTFLPIGIPFMIWLNVPVIIQASAIPMLLFLTVIVFAGGQFLLIKSIELDSMVTINALAYLTPVISSVFLNVFTGEQFTDSIIFGALLIVTANILLNNTLTHFYAFNGAIITFLFMGFVSYVDPSFLKFSSTDKIANYLAAVFSIFAGFTMSRVWEKARQEDTIATEIGRIVRVNLENLNDLASKKQLIDSFNVAMAKLDFSRNSSNLQQRAQTILESLDSLDFIKNKEDLRMYVKQWILLKIDRVSKLK